MDPAAGRDLGTGRAGPGNETAVGNRSVRQGPAARTSGDPDHGRLLAAEAARSALTAEARRLLFAAHNVVPTQNARAPSADRFEAAKGLFVFRGGRLKRRIELGHRCSRSGPYSLRARACRSGAVAAIAEIEADPALDVGLVRVACDPVADIGAHGSPCDEIPRDTGSRHVVGCLAGWSCNEIFKSLETFGGTGRYAGPCEGFGASDHLVAGHVVSNRRLSAVLDRVMPGRARRAWPSGSKDIRGRETSRSTREHVAAAGGGVARARRPCPGSQTSGPMLEEGRRTRPEFVPNAPIGPLVVRMHIGPSRRGAQGSSARARPSADPGLRHDRIRTPGPRARGRGFGASGPRFSRDAGPAGYEERRLRARGSGILGDDGLDPVVGRAVGGTTPVPVAPAIGRGGPGKRRSRAASTGAAGDHRPERGRERTEAEPVGGRPRSALPHAQPAGDGGPAFEGGAGKRRPPVPTSAPIGARAPGRAARPVNSGARARVTNPAGAERSLFDAADRRERVRCAESAVGRDRRPAPAAEGAVGRPMGDDAARRTGKARGRSSLPGRPARRRLGRSVSRTRRRRGR